RTTSAAKSPNAKSAVALAATLVATAVMLSSGWRKPAPSWASRSGATSAVGSPFRISRSFQPYLTSSAPAVIRLSYSPAAPADLLQKRDGTVLASRDFRGFSIERSHRKRGCQHRRWRGGRPQRLPRQQRLPSSGVAEHPQTSRLDLQAVAGLT